MTDVVDEGRGVCCLQKVSFSTAFYFHCYPGSQTGDTETEKHSRR